MPRPAPTPSRPGPKTLRGPSDPTPAEIRVLRAVADHRHRHGVTPHLGELVERLGLSKATVYQHLMSLKRKGAVAWEQNRKRSVVILRPELLPPRKRLVLPVLGEIS